MTTQTADTPSGPAVGNEMFVHNMRPLWRHDTELALRVDAVFDDERLDLLPTRMERPLSGR